jgi:hypothetical protein
MPIRTFLRKFARDYQYRTDAADDPQSGKQTAFRMHFLKAKAKPKSTTPITARLRLPEFRAKKVQSPVTLLRGSAGWS